MIGLQFGRLTVLAEVVKPTHIKKQEKYYLCVCTCGRQKIIKGYNLRKGRTTSCGCFARERASEVNSSKKNIPTGARKNLIGCVFDQLTVVAQAANTRQTENNPVGFTSWVCVCSCGNQEIRTGTSLKNKHAATHMCSDCYSKIVTERLLSYQATQQYGARFIDYSGRRYGRLLVLNRYPENIKGRTTYIVFCDCGTFKLVSREALDGGHTNSCGCFRREDSRNKMLVLRPTQVGPNNPSWNPNLTDEDRIDRRTLEPVIEWAKDVKARDKYTCKICGIHNNLHSHHLDSYRAHPERRVDPSNGVTLCKECHKKFHSTYGRKVTYEWQFVEYYYKNQNQKFLKLDIAA